MPTIPVIAPDLETGEKDGPQYLQKAKLWQLKYVIMCLVGVPLLQFIWVLAIFFGSNAIGWVWCFLYFVMSVCHIIPICLLVLKWLFETSNLLFSFCFGGRRMLLVLQDETVKGSGTTTTTSKNLYAYIVLRDSGCFSFGNQQLQCSEKKLWDQAKVLVVVFLVGCLCVCASRHLAQQSTLECKHIPVGTCFNHRAGMNRDSDTGNGAGSGPPPPPSPPSPPPPKTISGTMMEECDFGNPKSCEVCKLYQSLRNQELTEGVWTAYYHKPFFVLDKGKSVDRALFNAKRNELLTTMCGHEGGDTEVMKAVVLSIL